MAEVDLGPGVAHRQWPPLLVGTVRRVVVIRTRQETLEGSLCNVRGPSRVHVSAVGTTSSTTHKPPIIHAI